MELGADDYLTKPCTAAELLGAIAARLEKQAVLQQWYTAQSQRVSEPPPANTATIAPQSLFPSNPQMKDERGLPLH